MIRCKHKSRNLWRVKYITALRQRMIQIKTRPEIIDTFCSAITEWFNRKETTTTKYHKNHHPAIATQTSIGWRHIFMGKISQEWEKLQGRQQMRSGKYLDGYVWAANIVEVSIKHYIILWEQRNNDVHVKHNEQQTQSTK